MTEIDLNADVGEGCGHDAALLGLVTSANVACGWHAGDERTMTETVHAALVMNVAVGAHPSFPDRVNFGRTPMQRSPEDVYNDVVQQVRSLAAIVESQGGELRHVKPHGALYTMAAQDEQLADAIAHAVRECDARLALVGFAGSVSIRRAQALGLRTIEEAFADRRYTDEGQLVTRTHVNALIESAEEAVRQALAIVQDGTVTSITGRRIPVMAQSICLHGDGPQAVTFARSIRAALSDSGISICAR